MSTEPRHASPAFPAAPLSGAVSVDDLLAHRRWVRSLARRLVGSDSDADDLAQDAMVTALERPPRERAALRPWFRRVLLNRAQDRRRGEARRTAREHRAAVERPVPTPEGLAAAAESHRMVIDAVMLLDEPARDVVLLRYFEGLLPAEIALRRDVPASTVRTRLHRATKALRARLDERHGGDRSVWTAALGALIAADFAEGGGGTDPAGRSGRPAAPRARTAALATAAATAALLLFGAWTVFGRAGGDGGAPSDGDVATADAATRAPRARPRPERVERNGRAAPAGTGAPETAAAASTAPPADTSAEPPEAPAATGVVRVRVVHDERPVAGAVVRVLGLPAQGKPERSRGWRELESAHTDALGAAELSRPRDMLLHVRATSGGLAAFAVLQPVEGGAGGDAEVRMELGETVTLHGRVVDEAERPIEGARFVARMDVSDEDTVVRMATTGTDGRFELEDVPTDAIPRIVTYEVFATGHVKGWGAVNESTDTSEPIVVRLVAATTVTGRCVDESGAPVAGVYISWDSQKGVDSAADGTFRIRGLPRDRPTLDFKPESHVRTSRTLPLVEQPDHDLGDVVLARGVVARGIVRDAAGEALGDAHVCVYAGDDLVRQGQADEHGRFELEGVPDGPITVTASAPSDEAGWAAPLEGVVDDVHATHGDIDVRVSHSLSVVVELRLASDGSTVAVESLGIELTSLADPEVRKSRGFFGGAMNSVRARVDKAGRYRVTVTAKGHAPWTAESVEITEQGETHLTARLVPE